MDQGQHDTRDRLLSTAQIQERGAALSGVRTGLHYAAIVAHKTSEVAILHRSVYRDYFTLALKHIYAVGAPVQSALSKEFMRDFTHRFMDGDYDFQHTRVTAIIAREYGWVNPFGWDCQSGKIIMPLTHMFSAVAVQAAPFYDFHTRALNGQIELNAYETDVVTYVEDAIQADPGAPPIYNSVIKTAAHVAAVGIRLREEFELHTGRPMMRADWDALSGDMMRILLGSARGSQVRNFKQKMMICAGQQPFVFDGHDKAIKVTEGPIDEAEVTMIAGRLELDGFIDYYAGQPVTGCPAMRSHHSETGGLVTHLTKIYLRAIADDFWPSEKTDASPSGCPFHGQMQPAPVA